MNRKAFAWIVLIGLLISSFATTIYLGWPYLDESLEAFGIGLYVMSWILSYFALNSTDPRIRKYLNWFIAYLVLPLVIIFGIVIKNNFREFGFGFIVCGGAALLIYTVIWCGETICGKTKD